MRGNGLNGPTGTVKGAEVNYVTGLLTIFFVGDTPLYSHFDKSLRKSELAGYLIATHGISGVPMQIVGSPPAETTD